MRLATIATRLVVCLASCLFAPLAVATEPNESFAARTILSSGIVSVTDSLTPGAGGANPDTVLGVRDLFGSIYFSDDDGSPVGDGHASGIGNVSTNSGSIAFAVTGYPDYDFFGNHSESGGYEVFVDVYDFFGDPIDSFSQTAVLQPNSVDEYSFSNFEWIGGSYDVYIDNTVSVPQGGDVDFFTFTGLTPGASFIAETANVGAGDIDTLLGWFDDFGGLLVSDDDGAGGYLSRLEGVVPTGGTLTFAVSGYGDDTFTGTHGQDAPYQLSLSLSGGSPADFDGDGDVDGADLGRWRTNYGVAAGAAQSQGDANADGRVNGSDFVLWQRERTAPAVVNAAAVPEPSVVVLALAALCALPSLRLRKR